MNAKRLVGVILAVLSITVFQLTGGNAVLSAAGMKTVGVLLAFLFMLIFEVLPVVVTSLIFVALMPTLGVTGSLAASLYGYSQPVVFFTFASFGISLAMTTVPISKRILAFLLRRFGRNIEMVTLAMMCACLFFSLFVTNVPKCAIFSAIALDFLKIYENDADRRRTGRALMIGIPVASMIGGIIMPTSSSVNLLALSLLEESTGTTVSFAQWMCAGVPIALVLTPLAWLLVVKIFRPAPISEEQIRRFVRSLDIPEKLDISEIKVLVIVGIILVLWIASSWVTAINSMVVAIFGCCAMFLPGIDILDHRTFLRKNSWDSFFLVGCVLSISNAMIANGVSGAIADAIPVLHAGNAVIIMFAAALMFVALIFIPVSTSLVPIMILPLVSLASASGLSPALIVLTASIAGCNCYLLPLDTVTLITYDKGYYSMLDMPRCTVWLQLAVIGLCGLWLPVIGRLFGM